MRSTATATGAAISGARYRCVRVDRELPAAARLAAGAAVGLRSRAAEGLRIPQPPARLLGLAAPWGAADRPAHHAALRRSDPPAAGGTARPGFSGHRELHRRQS